MTTARMIELGLEAAARAVQPDEGQPADPLDPLDLRLSFNLNELRSCRKPERRWSQTSIHCRYLEEQET